jgi:predicted phage tail component-like protein
MASDAVLTLDGVTPAELGMGVFRRTQRPILSPTVDMTTAIPYMPGAYDFGATLGPKPFSLECAFIARDYLELQQRVSNLAAFLLDDDGCPRTMPIVFAMDPSKQYSVRYSGDLQIDRLAGLGTFTLPFVAYDPYAYSVDSTYDLVTWDTPLPWGDLRWSDGFSFTLTGSGAAEVNNIGHLNAEPIIRITGAFSSLSLTFGGGTFEYYTPFSGTLEVDFKRKLVRSGTTSLMLNTNAWLFSKLPPGVSSIIVGGSGINISMDVIFNFKYAS